MSRKARLVSQKIGAKAWILGGFFALSTLTGCASEPFVDGRREAGSDRSVGRSGLNRVAICYNSRSTTPEAVRQLAESECTKTDRVPLYDGEDILSCSIASPTRVFFRCVAPKS
ncbi:MAG: hypothetical protein GKS03_01380 [Alphaproteobacteria bacterium]|nr:hypothetical protein [Alphaproteobacteria bacterium]